MWSRQTAYNDANSCSELQEGMLHYCRLFAQESDRLRWRRVSTAPDTVPVWLPIWNERDYQLPCLKCFPDESWNLPAVALIGAIVLDRESGCCFSDCAQVATGHPVCLLSEPFVSVSEQCCVRQKNHRAGIGNSCGSTAFLSASFIGCSRARSLQK